MINCLSPEILARAESLGPAEIDWMFLETCFWSHSDEDRFHRSTLVVSCVPTSSIGAWLVPMADEWRGVTSRHGRCPADAGPGWLERTGAHDGGIEFGVVFARASEGLDAQALDGLMARMKADGVRHIVLVCADPDVREAVRQADSFVVGSVQTDVTTAGVMADILHNIVQAPATLNCFDFEDLAPPLGTARRPAVIAEALHRFDHATIEFLGPQDQAAFDEARLVALLPTLGRYRLSQVAGLVSATRALLRDREVELTYGAPACGFHASWNSMRFALVRYLCM